MPRQSYTAVIAHTTDAEFRTWAQQLSTALKACLTQTTDTGQVDLTTATRPGTGNTYAGYEIYKFSDTLQATKPVFIKVRYGTSSTLTTPSVEITVGTGTNGAGTLTGLFTASSIPVSRGQAMGTNPATTYVCYKDGTFTIAWAVNNAQPAGLCVVVDRSRDASGASISKGMTVIGTTASASPTVHLFSFDMTLLVTGAIFPCLTSTINSNSSSSALVNLYNWFCFTPDQSNVIGGLTYKNAEISPFAEIDVALVGGTSHHYVCLGTNSGQWQSWSAPGAANDVPAILWEV